MRIKKAAGENFSLAAAILILFTAGVIFGAVSIFNLPAEISGEAGEVLSSAIYEAPAMEEIKNNFASEAIWIIIIWVFGTLSTMAPLIAAAVAMRGFVIGFSCAFLIAGSGEALKLICAYIAPQCLFSLPLMTIFAIMCMRSCIERKSGEAQDMRYFVMGFVFLLSSLAVSAAESMLSRFFIHFL